ncbi:MAG: NADP-dependent oxidoreductase, partial [Williamsia herbipolensis]|nr:NADP-dependent oxidoreductase [Williamsia herbipolensis]
MHAVRFSEYGDPTVLRRDDVPIPEPDAGQVRIRVAATSFNGIDA